MWDLILWSGLLAPYFSDAKSPIEGPWAFRSAHFASLADRFRNSKTTDPLHASLLRCASNRASMTVSLTSTVFRAGCFVFYDLGFFSSLPALTCHVLTGCITWAGMRILSFGVHTSAPYRQWQSCKCRKQFPMNFGDLMLTR